MTKPTICVSLAEADPDACIAALADLECAEIRLDAMQATVSQVRRLFSQPPTLVATCRAGSHDDAMRQALLTAAIEAGAAYVDVELDAPSSLRAAVAATARRAGARLIVSHHDEHGTPPRDELLELRDRCFQAGADIAKLACWVRTRQEGARLLSLLDDSRELIVVGMGPLGRIVRMVAPVLGSPLAYAAARPGRETAPGQLDQATMARWLRELGRV